MLQLAYSIVSIDGLLIIIIFFNLDVFYRNQQIIELYILSDVLSMSILLNFKLD